MPRREAAISLFGLGPKLRPGDAAPGFKLAAHDGSQLELVGLRGRSRVLLVFCRELQAPDCLEALTGLQAALPRFAALGVRVLAVGEGEREAHAALAKRLGLGYLLLADPQRRIAKLYGAQGALLTFTRKAVVVDGRGVLRISQDGPPRLQDLLGYIEGLRGDLDPQPKGLPG